MRIPALLLALLVAAPAQADEATDPRDRAVTRAGLLNGTALACQRKDEADRLRRAVVDHAPKLREYGDLFEKATDTGFKEATRRPCPLPEALRLETDAAIQRVKKAFAAAN